MYRHFHTALSQHYKIPMVFLECSVTVLNPKTVEKDTDQPAVVMGVVQTASVLKINK